MSAEDKFYAAVNVIRNLPKNGSYQPSNEMMLKFYSYYKQATEGPNRKSKPSFWDLTNRAKWEAWNSLGQMSREDAMTAYVDQLNQIVETMAYTENVADFLSSLNSFYSSVPAEEVEMCIGPALDKMRSSTASPINGSAEGTPVRQKSEIEVEEEMVRYSSQDRALHDNDDDDDDEPTNDTEEEEYFLDTLEYTIPGEIKDKLDAGDVKHNNKRKPISSTVVVHNENYVEDKHNSGGSLAQIRANPVPSSHHNTTHHHSNHQIINGTPPGCLTTHNTDNVHQVLQRAVESLRRDLTTANDRVKKIEDKQKRVARNGLGLFGNLSQPTVIFLLGWPILVHLVLMWLFRRKRKQISYP